MSLDVEYVSHHLFVDGYWGNLTRDNYFHCYFKTCPFSLAMSVDYVSGKKIAVSCRSVIVPVHCHLVSEEKKVEVKRRVLNELKRIQQRPNDPLSVTFQQQHTFWNKSAHVFSKRFKQRLINIEAVKIYAMKHPEKSAKKIIIDSGLSLNPRSVNNMVLRGRVNRGETTKLSDLIKDKTHHLLGNDGEDIVVFGLSSSIHFLATTTLIQGDGTFFCVVHPFTQLYIFHALLLNGVSYPLLYCLVKGKEQSVYLRLLRLIERIALESGVTVFNRPVRLMVDFEKQFHNAALHFQAGRNLSCCFFHFVSNIKKNAKKVIDPMKRTWGNDSPEIKLAHKTKRAIMMLPLVPLDLIGVDVLDIIISRWRDAFQQHGTLFDDLRGSLIRNYLRPNARFPKHIWCVCGRAIRTNNSAESSHAGLNSSVRVCGAVSFDMFLYAIQSQMKNTSREIYGGCPSHSKKIYEKRNTLLSIELSDLIEGRQSILQYLDHCAGVMNVKNNGDFNTFTSMKRTEIVTDEDQRWIRENRQRVVTAGVSLYNLLHPSVRKSQQEIIQTITSWSYQLEQCETNLNIIEDDSTLSFARHEVQKSFLEILEGLGGEYHPDGGRVSDERSLSVVETERTLRVFEGDSYKLEWRTIE